MGLYHLFIVFLQRYHIHLIWPYVFRREMIFIQPLFDNVCDNLISHIYIMFLLFLSIVLIFVLIPFFLCKIMVVQKVVQITQLFSETDTTTKFFYIELVSLSPKCFIPQKCGGFI